MKLKNNNLFYIILLFIELSSKFFIGTGKNNWNESTGIFSKKKTS